MLEHSVSYYLSKYWTTTPLYREKLIPLLDNVLSPNYVYADKLSNALFHVIDKYKNTSELPFDELKELVVESGYEYIFDILRPLEENLKILVYLIVLIHQLKGSEDGIRIVLSLFQDEVYPDDIKITSWYNSIPVGTENTFSITSALDISKVAGFDFYKKFKKFIQSYVYPELTKLSLRYSMKACQTPFGYSRMKIRYSNKYKEDTTT